MIYSTIIQKDLKLVYKGDIPLQFSSDIKIKFIKDEKYQHYTTSVIGAYNKTPNIERIEDGVGEVLEIDEDGIFIIPAHLLSKSGYLFITFILSNEYEDVTIGTVKYAVYKAIGGEVPIPTNNTSIPTLVNSLVSQRMLDYVLKADLEGLLDDYVTFEDLGQYLTEKDLEGYATLVQVDEKLVEYVKDPLYTHTDNNFTNAYKDKIDSLSDPSIDTISVNGSVQLPDINKNVDISIPTQLSDLVNDIKAQENVIESVSINGEQAPTIGKNVSITLSNVAKTGDYDDLTNKPSNVSDFNNDVGYLQQSSLDEYAKFDDIPTNLSELINDSDYITQTESQNAIDALKLYTLFANQNPIGNINLRTITDNGSYLQNSSMYATLANNYPIEQRGLLLVFSYPNISGMSVVQMYITHATATNKNKVYVCERHNDIWYDWNLIGDIDLSDKVSKQGDNLSGNLSFDNAKGIILKNIPLEGNTSDEYRIISDALGHLKVERFIDGVLYATPIEVNNTGVVAPQYVQTSTALNVTPKNVFVESTNEDGHLVKLPKNNLMGIGNTAFKLDKNNLNTTVSNNQQFNLLSIIDFSNAIMTHNTILGTDFKLVNNILYFPTPKVVDFDYTKYDIIVRLSGTLGGSAIVRDFEIIITRGDDSFVDSTSLTKSANSDLKSKSAKFVTYTKGQSDPFYNTGIKLVLDNQTGADINITGITILVNGNNTHIQ